MSQPIFSRLRKYYAKIAAVLRGEADVASVFPNTTDIGLSREGIYAEFLRNHLPSKCNVFLGGFVFDEQEKESKQLDIIITTDTTPRFKPTTGSDKSFSPIEGTLGVVSVKSNLNKEQLIDAVAGIASIPPMAPLDKRVSPLLKISDYEDWPLKVIYATESVQPETLLSHLNEFYQNHAEILFARRPNIIHVAGKCCIIRIIKGWDIQDPVTGQKIPSKIGEYHLFTKDPDLQAITWTLNMLQQNAVSSTHILFSYQYILNNVLLRTDNS